MPGQDGYVEISVFLEGNGTKAEVSNHLSSVRSFLEIEKFCPLKKESVPNATGTPDWILYCPVSCHPPRKMSANLDIDPASGLPRPMGISQIGAMERWKGRSSPPSLCSTTRPAISGPQNDVSSKSFDQVNELITENPLLKRRSTLTSMAS